MDDLSELSVHFKVPQHYLPYDEFLVTAHTAREIVDNLNIALCGGQLNYQLVVLPAEAGTFLTRLGIIVTAACVFAESGMGGAFIKGLTKHSPEYWAEQTGQSFREITTEAVGALTTGRVISECTKNFLRMEEDELGKVGITKENFRDAYEAKNNFYLTCIQNKQIEALGFDHSNKFPIKRSDFPRYIVNLPPAKEEPIENWKVETTRIKVTSPNWERDALRHWKGKYKSAAHTWFTIEDEWFWHLVKTQKLKTKIMDVLKVQWAFPADTGRRSHVKVLKVLKYNGQKVSEPYSKDELKEILRNYTIADDGQGDLFDKA